MKQVRGTEATAAKAPPTQPWSGRRQPLPIPATPLGRCPPRTRTPAPPHPTWRNDPPPIVLLAFMR